MNTPQHFPLRLRKTRYTEQQVDGSWLYKLRRGLYFDWGHQTTRYGAILCLLRARDEAREVSEKLTQWRQS